MTGIAYAAAVMLALVLLSAGGAKLRNRSGTEAAMAALGLPAAPALAIAVPTFEVILALGLVVRPGPAAAVAAITLSAFTIALARAIRTGSVVTCGCFGGTSTTRVGPPDLVRNTFLVAAAVLAAVAAPVPAPPSLPALVIVTTSGAVGGVVIALARLHQATGQVLGLGSLEALR